MIFIVLCAIVGCLESDIMNHNTYGTSNISANLLGVSSGLSAHLINN